ncbi:unnamed protein product [Alternaria alternata]
MAPKKKTQQGASSRPAPSSEPARQPPNWPALTPLVPEEDLALQEVLHKQIVTIPNFFTASLCKTYVSFLSSLPLTTTPGKPKKGDAVRVNDRYQIDDPQFAERLWSQTGLRKLVSGDVEEGALGLSVEQRKDLWGGEVLGLNQNIRIYRYSKGQFFDQHCCMGGETVFYPDLPRKKSRDPPPEPLVVDLEVGLALLHRHGADCMLHEGREVTGGEKWVIRSDLCVKR